MKIDLALVPVLWYENEKGARWVPSQKDMEVVRDPPPGFIYQRSAFPSELHETFLKLVQAAEVEACDHPDVRKTDGWIDGVEGRECKRCFGSQSKKVEEPWPEKWDAYGSRRIASGTSGWSEDLVLALAIRRWWRFRKVYTLGEAIRIVANCCERCLNVLGDRYGMKWGYKEGSEEWEKCGTRCQFCS